MWSARGAYRNADGRIVPLPERSPLWTDKGGLLSQIKQEHPGLTSVPCPIASHGDWYRWVDEADVERFVVIEDHR